MRQGKRFQHFPGVSASSVAAAKHPGDFQFPPLGVEGFDGGGRDVPANRFADLEMVDIDPGALLNPNQNFDSRTITMPSAFNDVHDEPPF